MLANKANHSFGYRLGYFLRIIFFTLLLTTASWQTGFSAVSRITDANGVIHISNNPKAETRPDKVESTSFGQTIGGAQEKLPEPTPSNIFPEPDPSVVPSFLAAEPE